MEASLSGGIRWSDGTPRRRRPPSIWVMTAPRSASARPSFAAGCCGVWRRILRPRSGSCAEPSGQTGHGESRGWAAYQCDRVWLGCPPPEVGGLSGVHLVELVVVEDGPTFAVARGIEQQMPFRVVLVALGPVVEPVGGAADALPASPLAPPAPVGTPVLPQGDGRLAVGRLVVDIEVVAVRVETDARVRVVQPGAGNVGWWRGGLLTVVRLDRNAGVDRPTGGCSGYPGLCDQIESR